MFLIIHPIASQMLKIFKFDQEMQPLQRKRISSEILAENPAFPPKNMNFLKSFYFLLLNPKTSCKPKVVTLDQEMRPLLRKKLILEIFAENFHQNRAPPP